jgi:NADPH2:quinone reductase
MKAIRIDAVGEPDVMRLVEAPDPDPGPGEIRIRHAAIGVNFIDIYHRTGAYPLALPTGLGLEAAGVVEAVGEDVTAFQPGDRAAYCTGPIGAYAHAHVTRADRAVPLPPTLSFDEAAGSLLKGLTAYYLLRKTFPVTQGTVVVIYAAAGGTGQIAVQWAKHLGAVVLAVVGSEQKAAIARALGADHTLLLGRDDIPARVRDITKGEGADVVYDSVGRSTLTASLDSLKPMGMLVSFGSASGPLPPLDPALLAAKGSLFFTRPTLFDYTRTPERLREAAADLFAAFASKAVNPPAPTRYSLAEASRAHEDLEARKTTGSVILCP